MIGPMRLAMKLYGIETRRSEVSVSETACLYQDGPFLTDGQTRSLDRVPQVFGALLYMTDMTHTLREVAIRWVGLWRMSQVPTLTVVEFDDSLHWQVDQLPT